MSYYFSLSHSLDFIFRLLQITNNTRRRVVINEEANFTHEFEMDSDEDGRMDVPSVPPPPPPLPGLHHITVPPPPPQPESNAVILPGPPANPPPQTAGTEKGQGADEHCYKDAAKAQAALFMSLQPELLRYVAYKQPLHTRNSHKEQHLEIQLAHLFLYLRCGLREENLYTQTDVDLSTVVLGTSQSMEVTNNLKTLHSLCYETPAVVVEAFNVLVESDNRNLIATAEKVYANIHTHT